MIIMVLWPDSYGSPPGCPSSWSCTEEQWAAEPSIPQCCLECSAVGKQPKIGRVPPELLASLFIYCFLAPWKRQSVPHPAAPPEYQQWSGSSLQPRAPAASCSSVGSLSRADLPLLLHNGNFLLLLYLFLKIRFLNHNSLNASQQFWGASQARHRWTSCSVSSEDNCILNKCSRNYIACPVDIWAP